MTIEEFNDVNKLFRTLISEEMMMDVWDCIDGESLISRVYKKCESKIDIKLLAVIMLYNKHIEREEYEAVKNMKKHIIDFY
jgi:hypothetical protein